MYQKFTNFKNIWTFLTKLIPPSLPAGSRPVFPVRTLSGRPPLRGTLPPWCAGRRRHGDLEIPRPERPVPLLPPQLHPGVRRMLATASDVMKKSDSYLNVFCVCVSAGVQVLDCLDALGKTTTSALIYQNDQSSQKRSVLQNVSVNLHVSWAHFNQWKFMSQRWELNKMNICKRVCSYKQIWPQLVLTVQTLAVS